jgi:hypothetical protein
MACCPLIPVNRGWTAEQQPAIYAGSIQVVQIDRIAVVSDNRVISGQSTNLPNCPTCITGGPP